MFFLARTINNVYFCLSKENALVALTKLAPFKVQTYSPLLESEYRRFFTWLFAVIFLFTAAPSLASQASGGIRINSPILEGQPSESHTPLLPDTPLPQEWKAPIPGVAAAPNSRIDSTFYSRYSYIRFVDKAEDADLVQLTDEDFLDRAGKIIFRVNRYDAFTNDSLLKELEEVVIPRINSDSLRLVKMVLRGAASPEGPVPNNRMLGRRRAETLAIFLRARLSVPVEDKTFTAETVTEDYRLLCAMMLRAADKDLATVKKLCDYHLPRYEYTILKRKLMALQGGRLWKRLLKEYFPELRAARLILIFEKAEVEETFESQGSHAAVKTHDAQVYEPEYVPEPEYTLVPRVVEVPRREVLSVKSNLLFDFAYMPGYERWCPIPNVAIEYYPLHGHFTYGASIDFPWWQHYNDHKYFQIRNYQVETRYYIHSGDVERCTPGTGAAYRGLYIQAYAHAALFNICFDENRGWEGEGLGGGLGIGYVLPLTKKGHWRLEFGAQFGALLAGYDPYQFENPVNPNYRDQRYYYKWSGKAADFNRRQYRFTWLGPTRVGITLTYDLLYRRWKKKGVSFKNSEMTVEYERQEITD